MTEHWPPPGARLPGFDAEDLRPVGWRAVQVDHGQFAGHAALLTGECPDHFAIVLPPGSHVGCREDGTLVIDGAVFLGGDPCDPGCRCVPH